MNMQGSGGIIRERILVLEELPIAVTHSENEEVDTIYAARHRNLGLTAYGDNQEEAVGNLAEALRTFVGKLFEKGTLTDRLTQAGVRWYWEQDAPGWTSIKDDRPSRNNVTERLLVRT